jgi:hypothetical protein
MYSITNKLCLNCAKEFSARTSNVKRGGGKFCSHSCVVQHTNKNRKYFDLVCKECHKEFQSKNKWAKFCSRSCSSRVRRAEFLKERGVSRSSLYFQKNKEKIYGQRRKLRENPDYVEKQRKYHVEYRNKNIETSLKREAALRIKNKETINASQAKWLKNNRDKRLEHVKRYNDKKLGTPLGRLETNCRGRIWQAFKNKGFKKNTKTQKMLGCSYEELKCYIEAKFKKGMTWDNYGTLWEVDHIVPYYLAKTEEEIISLSHYSNLQPLWAKENGKGGKGIKIALNMISAKNRIKYKDIIPRGTKCLLVF